VNKNSDTAQTQVTERQPIPCSSVLVVAGLSSKGKLDVVYDSFKEERKRRKNKAKAEKSE
jgi:hypothetical protein